MTRVPSGFRSAGATAALVFATLVWTGWLGTAWAGCKTHDWTQPALAKRVTSRQKQALRSVFFDVPLIVRGQVLSAKVEQGRRNKAGRYEFELRVDDYYKGYFRADRIRVSYDYEEASKPRQAAPATGEQWVVFLSRVRGEHGKPNGTRCGQLGFPTTQSKLYEAFQGFAHGFDHGGLGPRETGPTPDTEPPLADPGPPPAAPTNRGCAVAGGAESPHGLAALALGLVAVAIRRRRAVRSRHRP